jgi:biotin carboxylase
MSEPKPKRVLVLAATTGYQTRVFEEAARRIGFEPVMATDRCLHLPDPWGDGAVAVRFQEPEAGAEALAKLDPAPDGIVAVGDAPTRIAALTAAKLGLRFHTHEAVVRCRDKFIAHERFREAGLPCPEYFRVPVHVDLAEAVRSVRFPCVLKPLGLSGSRGVIRANDEAEFAGAFERICAILSQPEVRRVRETEQDFIQIEEYIPGREFALEGLVIDGVLQTLAIFEKPDPLEGPFFEETVYLTPPRISDAVTAAIIETTRRAVTALGLTNGPVHAEMRVNETGVYMLEAAARPIGGLCAQSLRFAGDATLEEILLRFAVGEDISGVRRETSASGVMMIPIPSSGIYSGVAGLEEARSVPGVTDVVVTAKEGQRMVRLPEGASYLGFIFARGNSPDEVEAALRLSHSHLIFQIMAELPAMRPGA